MNNAKCTLIARSIAFEILGIKRYKYRLNISNTFSDYAFKASCPFNLDVHVKINDFMNSQYIGISLDYYITSNKQKQINIECKYNEDFNEDYILGLLRIHNKINKDIPILLECIKNSMN